MNSTKINLYVILTLCFMFLFTFETVKAAGKNAEKSKYKYNFNGWDSNHCRHSNISFNITSDGLVTGKQYIKPVCENKMKLAGGKISFSGILSGSYPQVSGNFKGKAIFCGGKSSPIQGTMKLGYHPNYGIFIQLFGVSGSGEEYYFKNAKNPF